MSWISVKERLPEAKTWVLTLAVEFYTQSEMPVVMPVVNMLSEMGNWISDVYGDTKRVTHWMPLPPEPPEKS